MRIETLATITSVLLLHCATTALAADPAETCQRSKLKEAAKYGQCRLKAESIAIKQNTAPDFSKCQSTLSAKWSTVEAKAGAGVCPSEGDLADIDEHITECTSEIAILLAGGIVPSHELPATGQTLSFGAGDDGAVEAGGTLAYLDNGDGTITDLNTGLMWEKKVASDDLENECNSATLICANPHDADNSYAWTAGTSGFTGGVVTVFLTQLNNRCNASATVACATNGDCVGVNEVCNTSNGKCRNDMAVVCATNADCAGLVTPCGFAGYRDWRLPNIRELETITDYTEAIPAVAPAFHGASCGPACTDITNPACSCTWIGEGSGGDYWSSTTSAQSSASAWRVFVGSGISGAFTKTEHFFARAVRGGL